MWCWLTVMDPDALFLTELRDFHCEPNLDEGAQGMGMDNYSFFELMFGFDSLQHACLVWETKCLGYDGTSCRRCTPNNSHTLLGGWAPCAESLHVQARGHHARQGRDAWGMLPEDGSGVVAHQSGWQGPDQRPDHRVTLEESDTMWMMQKGRDHKRQRSPTPRRRRIPARGRVHFEPSERQYRRSQWMRGQERPTCSSSWAGVPWRRPRNSRAPS